MQEASDALSKTADSDTVSTYQVSSVQVVTDKKLEAFNKQRWALPQIGPQIRKLRTQVFICGFANLISYRKYLRICCEKSKFTANLQTNRQCCLIRGKTARKKWTLSFSGLEVDDRELMTFFFFWRAMSGPWQNLTFKIKKVITKTK